MEEEVINLMPSPRLLEVLGDIPFAHWQCIAELVDNAFDAFLAASEKELPKQPTVTVTLPEVNDPEPVVVVEDNGRGMSLVDLENALTAGYSGNSAFGTLGLFGMGFNVATARLGRVTTVRTSRRGDSHWLEVKIDFDELNRRAPKEKKSFDVRVIKVPKEDKTKSGTHVKILVRPERVAGMSGSAPNQIRRTLGDVYSFLLRSSVPGLTQKNSNGLGFQLVVQGQIVEPVIPCIFSDKRGSTYYGSEVEAVQYIDKPLSDAWACNSCGQWIREPDPEVCTNCESVDLDKRERKIWGWLGVQRYLSTSDFGISVLRNGRKILRWDKSFFVWTDPDTGSTENEYPVEMPANRGRLVGEIHIDHMRPTYQKNDFDRSTRDWSTLRKVVRGDTELKPKSAKRRAINESNWSPLSKLFSTFRRNDPGAKCLTIGNGEKATLELSADWGKKFHQGLDEYQSDEKWWNECSQHDRVVTGDFEINTDEKTGEVSIGDDLIGGFGNDDEKFTVVDPQQAIAERFEEYQIGRQRTDLSVAVVWPNTPAITVETYMAPVEVQNDKNEKVAIASLFAAQNVLLLAVDQRHKIFTEFGRSIEDVVIFEVASHLKSLSESTKSTVEIFEDLLGQFPDQKLNHAASVEKEKTICTRLVEPLFHLVKEGSAIYWNALTNEDKERVQETALSQDPTLDLGKVIESGDFAMYLDLESVSSLLKRMPEALMDGSLFTPKFSGLNEKQQKQVLESVLLPLENIATMMKSPSQNVYHLRLLRIYFDQLFNLVTDE
jgi:hypothetical protein